MNNDQIVSTIIEEGYNMTDNPYEAIYILTDGQLISGDFDYGSRGTDHRMIEIVTPINRYDKNFWDYVHRELKLVMLVPETKVALIKKGQELTAAQKNIIKQLDYDLEIY